MNNLLFDLDGTLWRTNGAYLYGYHKLVEKYGITDPKSDEEVLTYLGVDVKNLFVSLFSDVEDKQSLLSDAVKYALEYISNNVEESITKGTRELLIKLSSKYKIYIVSNCPMAFAKGFLDIADINDLDS